MSALLNKRSLANDAQYEPSPAKRLAVDPPAFNDAPAASSKRALSFLTEKDVGIYCYISPSCGFSGAIKQRFTDFIVHEIDNDGAIVRLTDTSIPSDILTQGVEVPSEAAAADFKTRYGEEMCTRLEALASGENTTETTILLPAPLEKDARKLVHDGVKLLFPALESGTVAMTALSPEQQAAVRALVPAAAEAAQVITTNAISVTRRGGRGGKGGRSAAAQSQHHARPGWPKGRPDYLRFALHKTNYDTTAAVHALCAGGGLREATYGYAGMKDKRGATTQWVTAYRVLPSRLAGIAHRLAPGIAVGNYSWTARRLRLGDLRGNRFTLTIRQLRPRPQSSTSAGADAGAGAGASASSVDTAEAGEAAARAALSAWCNPPCSCRFINYFGLQRFGTGAVPTQEVGAAILRGDWTSAVDALLRPRAGEGPDATAAREYYAATGDASGTASRLPPFARSEIALLRSLARSATTPDVSSSSSASSAAAPSSTALASDGSAFIAPTAAAARAAIESIPVRQRNIYLHAYQSHLWNRLASARIRMLGNSAAVVGDLVLAASKGSAAASSTSALDEDSLLPGDDTEDALVEAAETPSASAAAAAGEAESGGGDASGPSNGRGELPAVRALTADDIASGAYSIADVLLPIPGYATRFPSHAAGCAAAVAELMAGDGVIARADTAKLRAIADPAARDAVAVELMQPVWKPRARRDFQLAGSYRRLVECARDVQWRVVQHSTAEQQLVLTDLDTVQKRGLEPHLESDAGAAYLSLVLEFSLGRSCYATMALRELMRVETDKTFQASLNK